MDLDFSKLSLLDLENKIQYATSDVYQATIVAIPARSKITLFPQNSIKRVLMIPFPEKMKPEVFEFMGEPHEISFLK